MNTDNFFFNGLNFGGIGSIFRDDQDNSLIYLAKHVCADLTINVEILAIRECFVIVVTSCWTNSTSFIFRTNFTNAVL